MYAIDGELVKNGKELFFVNRTKTEHGFHGKIDEKTEFFDNNVKQIKEDFEFKENMKVIAMFNPSANADVWIKISNIPIPENVFRKILVCTWLLDLSMIQGFLPITDLYLTIFFVEIAISRKSTTASATLP